VVVQQSRLSVPQQVVLCVWLIMRLILSPPE